ncbi:MULTISPECIES: glycoside hydrolase family 2 protein [unclassified Flavobacterium]|jgi:exo-1,4-beta-D-glucosaminidase|uniref:glycoside hydrolase family 2 protein n=2 Tax=Flavobacterium TaxID=237 RepID=UPI0025B8638C|nr:MULTISPECIES: sugar-binding domain-containing protein [unclassified Flavobacterium]
MRKTSRSLILFILIAFSQYSFAVTKPIISRRVQLKENWKVGQNNKVLSDGATISSSDNNSENWYKASVPSTVMGVLTANGFYKDIFVGTNYKELDKTQFDDSWWYKTEFDLPNILPENNISLHFDGINYYANIWLNGKLIASRDKVFGTFQQFEFDITALAKKKGNILAVEIFRAQPGDYNIGFVDWNPRPLDENMGIWRPVYVEIDGEVGLKNTVVQSKVNTSTLKEAWLTVKTELENYTSEVVSGTLVGKIGRKEFRYPVKLNPNETRNLSLTSKEIPSLYIKNPKLWWCNNLGEPNLYNLSLRFETGKNITDSDEITFGIREIDTYFTAEGHKGFILNGKKILIKGGGWTDDIFLRDTKQSLETQLQYVKHMNLNTLRFEGIWGTSQEIYDLCDKYGIMAMVGWSCQWEWIEYLGKPCDAFGGIQTDADINLALESLADQIYWLRNHPSIFVWFLGSDKLPRPELEIKYKNLIDKIDNRPYLLTAGTRTSEVSGPVGVKMNGPYEYVSPNYWFEDTKKGGAFGFNTETSPGAQIPSLETIKKMIPKDKLWPINSAWNYHCTSSLLMSNNLDVNTLMIDKRYGKSEDINEYLMKSDALGYEAMRGMFEGFRARIPKATGIIQWMLNSAWPSFYWQLYDYYLLPTSGYYATRKANNITQLIYDYAKNQIIAVNESLNTEKKLKAQITVYDFNSNLLKKEILNFDINSISSRSIFQMDSYPEGIFLDLKLFDKKGVQIASNLYWLSNKKDVFDWDKSLWGNTPFKEYADFTKLNDLPKSEITTTYSIKTIGTNEELNVTLTNTNSKMAFFIHLNMTDSQNNTIFPVFWDDNYVSVLPNEKRTIKCVIPKNLVQKTKIRLVISGWNVGEQTHLLEIK